MAMKFCCPVCKKVSQTDESNAGKVVKCPQGHLVRVPPAQKTPAPVPLAKTRLEQNIPAQSLPAKTRLEQNIPAPAPAPVPVEQLPSPPSRARAIIVIGSVALMALILLGLGGLVLILAQQPSDSKQAKTKKSEKPRDETVQINDLSYLKPKDPKPGFSTTKPKPDQNQKNSPPNSATEVVNPVDPGNKKTPGTDSEIPDVKKPGEVPEDFPPEDPKVAEPDPKPPESTFPYGEPEVVIPLNLKDLRKSDRLTFNVPPVKKSDPPPPSVWEGHTNHIRGVAYAVEKDAEGKETAKFAVSVSGDVYPVMVNGRVWPRDFSIRVCDVLRGKQVSKARVFREALDGLSISPGGRFACFGYGGHYDVNGSWIDAKDSSVRMWDILKNKQIFAEAEQVRPGMPLPVTGTPKFVGLKNSVFCSAFGLSNNRLLGGDNDGNMVVWDVFNGRPVQRIKMYPRTRYYSGGSYKGLSFIRIKMVSGDRYALTCHHDWTVRLWDLMTGKEVARLENHQDIVWGIDVTKTPDGKFLALSGGGGRQGIFVNGIEDGERDYAIRLWDLGRTPPRILRTFQGHTKIVGDVVFRPNSNHFLSAGDDATVRLWNWETGKLLRTYRGHTGLIRSIAVSPDGKTAVSGGDDCKVHFWQLPATADDLIVALNDNNLNALTNAAKDLDTMDTELAAVFPQMAQGLNHKNPAFHAPVRQVMHKYAELWKEGSLQQLGADSLNGLVTILKTEKESVELQQFALASLQGLGSQATSAVPVVCDTMDSGGEAGLLADAAKTLGLLRVKNDRTITVLKKGLKHSSPLVRLQSLKSLEQLGNDTVTFSEFLELANDSDPQIKTLAARGIQNGLVSFDKNDLPEIRKGLQHSDRNICLSCTKTVTNLGTAGQPAAPELSVLLTRKDSELQSAVLEAIRKIGASQAELAVVKLLQSEPPTKIGTEATFTLAAIAPNSPDLAGLGTPYLLKSLEPPTSNFALNKEYLQSVPSSKSVKLLVQLGSPVLDPIVRTGLQQRWKPSIASLPPSPQKCAARFAAYMVLRELTKKAATNQALRYKLAALKPQIERLWNQHDKFIEKRSKSNALLPEKKFLYQVTSIAAWEVYQEIKKLR